MTEAVGRLGTEGAFAVLARARALEASGRDVIHLEIGEPDFETPTACRRGRHRRDQGGRDALLPDGRACRFCARRQRRRSPARAASPIDRERVLVANGAKPFLFFTVLATCGPGDEVVYPDPGFPIYESAVRFAGADAGPAAAPRGARVQLRPGRARAAPGRAHPPRHPERAAEPDRRRDPRGRPAAGGRGDPRDAGVGAQRRGVSRGSRTTSTRRRSRRCPGCSSARSSSTASRRRSP